MKSILAVVVAALLAGCMTAAPTQPTSISTASAPPGADPGRVAALLDQLRVARGLSTLAEDPRLTAAARNYAGVMARTGHFSHTGPDGSSLSDRARAAGYPCVRAENLAYGPMTDAQVISSWMASPGHRRNILLRDAREFGYGRAGDKMVLVLGSGC
ncbi:MAG: CAP domain-containing protein [Alphaproteobacteria bacterium]|nr:CAP domain-containing protein [Alphaproteobacteria bacterium]